MRTTKAILKRTNTIGKNIRYYRRRAELTQDQLAYQCYLRGQSYISMIENGKYIPSLKIILRIADVLKVSPAQLLVDADGEEEFLKLYNELPGRMKVEVKRYMRYLFDGDREFMEGKI